LKQEKEKTGRKEKNPKQQPDKAEAVSAAKTEGKAEAGEKAANPEAKAQADAKGSSEELNKELEETKKKLKETTDTLAQQKDAFLRTAAEYDNFRKRTEREKQALYADATADAVKEILSVADNLERALEQKDCSAEDLRKGVEMTQKQMQAALKKLNVAEMGKEGEPFDPTLHSAVSHIDDESLGENVIAKVFQKGYTIDGKVVRHAMVQVAN
jgi:molecular chaperone GrpE